MNDVMPASYLIDLASFMEDPMEFDFFDNVNVPPMPRMTREIRRSPLGSDHGLLVFYIEEHRWGTIKINWWWEDGWNEWKLMLGSETNYREGTVVNRTWYAPTWKPREKGQAQWEYWRREVEAIQQPVEPDPKQHQHPSNRAVDVDNSNSKQKISQARVDNSNQDNDLHPLLRGDFPPNPNEYRWPQLPKYDAYDPGEQQDLFGEDEDDTDFFGRPNK